jgi:hypothetical protein
MNIYNDLYWTEKTGWRSNNDYLDSITLEVIRPLGFTGQRYMTFIPGKTMVMFTCGDRLCMRFEDPTPRVMIIWDEAESIDEADYSNLEKWADKTIHIGSIYPSLAAFHSKNKCLDPNKI